ncbi:MAG: hypothetical protein GY720_06465 [bacterium]|nr:hypothetical protein [bacterium]
MARGDFVDPGPLLQELFDERVRGLEEDFPEPRSRRDRKRLRQAKRRLWTELHRAGRHAHWLTDSEAPRPDDHDHMEELVQRALEVPTGSMKRDLALFAEIRRAASRSDVPLLLETMQSDRANFWIREMLAEPACDLGGPKALPELLGAFAANTAEGHDNDSFSVHLIGLVEEEPAASAAVLSEIIEEGDADLRPIAGWLLEYCS